MKFCITVVVYFSDPPVLWPRQQSCSSKRISSGYPANFRLSKYGGGSLKYTTTVKGGSVFFRFSRANFWKTISPRILELHIWFFHQGKSEKIYFEIKSFLPPQKVFYFQFTSLFRSFLGYFVSIFGICEKKIILDFKNSFSQNSSNFMYMVPILFAQTQAIWFEPPNRFTPHHVMFEKVEFLFEKLLGWTRFGMKNRFWTSKIDFFKILQTLRTWFLFCLERFSRGYFTSK